MYKFCGAQECGFEYRVIGKSFTISCSHWDFWMFQASKLCFWDFPSDTVVKNQPANAGDTGLSSGPGRSHMPQSN